jgi:hypothetical protein
MKFIQNLFETSVTMLFMCNKKTNQLMLYIVRIIREMLSTVSSLGKIPRFFMLQ